MGGSCSKGSKTTDPDKAPYGPKTQRGSKKGSKRIQEDKRTKSAVPVKTEPVTKAPSTKSPATKQPVENSKPSVVNQNNSEVLQEESQSVGEVRELTPRSRPPKKEYKYTPKSTIDVVQETINADIPLEPGQANNVKPLDVDDVGAAVGDAVTDNNNRDGFVEAVVPITIEQSQLKSGDFARNEDGTIKDSKDIKTDIVENPVEHYNQPQKPNQSSQRLAHESVARDFQKNDKHNIDTATEGARQPINDSIGEFHEKKSEVATSPTTDTNNDISGNSVNREFLEQHTILTSATIESSTVQRETVHTTYTTTRSESSQPGISAAHPDSGRPTSGIPSGGHVVTSQVTRQQRTERVINSEVKNTGPAGTESHMAIFDAMKALRSAKSTPATSPASGASGKFFSLYNTESKIMSDILSQSAQTDGARKAELGMPSGNNFSDGRNYQGAFTHSDGRDSSKISGLTENSSRPAKIVI